MNKKNLKKIWKQEEDRAHIQGWDFSHIHGRYEEENDLPWDYAETNCYLSGLISENVTIQAKFHLTMLRLSL